MPPSLDKLATKAPSTGYGLKVLAESGIIRPYSPARAGPGRPRAAAVGHRPRRRVPGDGHAAARPGLGRSTSSAELTFGEIDRRTNALARALAELGVGEGDSVALMAATTAASSRPRVAAAKLGADLIYLNTAFAGPQLVDVLEREEPTRRDPRRGVHRHAREGRRRAARVLGVGRRTTPDARTPSTSLIEGEPDDATCAAPEPPQPDHHPDLRHHRHAEGRAPQRGRHRRGDLAAVADAAEERLAGAHRGAAVPHLGLRAHRCCRCCSATRSCCAGSSTRRPRSTWSTSSSATRWS